MSDVSPLLALPLIQPAQAQKHITHNSAIDRLDMLVQVVVEAFEATTPPGAPLEGQIWALGALPLGAWAGQPQTLASWRNGAWVFIAPAAGWRAWGRSEARLRIFAAGVWGPLLGDGDLQNLTGVGINAASDATNRLTVSAPASLFSHQGGGHQVKVNKATPGDTASLLFQSGWSGRAEIGLAGSDDLAVKVSADGSLFQTGLSVAAASGVVTAPAGLRVAAGSATAPGLSFDGDPDTGLLRPAANQIGLATAGVQRALLSGSALQLDVALTGTAVQSSTTDASAGRLMKVGAFGLGDGIGLTGALNSTIAPGFYSYIGSDANRPNTSAAGGSFIVSKHSLLWTRQISFVGGAVNCYQRFSSDGGTSWSTWREFYTGPVVGTVSQSGGIPTGAIVERGTNANGDYVRFADGTQICRRTFAENIAIATAHLGGFRDAGRTWTYPAAFNASPVLQVGSGSTGAFGGFSNGSGFLAVSIFCTAVTSQTAADRIIHCTAIGQWY